MEEMAGFAALLMIGFVVLLVVWTVLPFIVLSMNTKLRRILTAQRDLIDLQKQTNHELESLRFHMKVKDGQESRRLSGERNTPR